MEPGSSKTAINPAPGAPTPSGPSPAPSANGVSKGVTSQTPVPKVGYIYDPRMMSHSKYMEGANGIEHDNDDDDDRHPEQPSRISRIHAKLLESGCIQLMHQLEIRQMSRDEAILVHSEDHWNKVAAIAAMDEDMIRNSIAYYDHLSLYVHPKTPEAALLSAGGVIEASLAVANGKTKTAFANVRPPGHHAEPEEHMGFCFFNNVAVAARVVQEETPLKKILILDWDVHHGNGTQRAFYDNPSILYVSIHRFDSGTFYPGGPFGSMESCGEGDGLGYSVNVPWPMSGATDADYLYAFMRIVMPIAYEFAPDLVMISAGFDAAEGDTLGECHVTPAGYAHMTHMLASLAGGKVVVALEGGYNLTSISNSALAVAEVLLGNPPPMMPELTASEMATETVWQVSKVQSRYWKSINPKHCEPKEEYDDAIPVTEVLKLHRLQRMQEFGVYYIMLPEYKGLSESFDKQVLCTNDFYQKQRLVVFIHDYGSMRAEIQGATHVDLELESAYILESTNTILNWMTEDGFALMDINVFPHMLNQGANEGELLKSLMIYLWDNYIELSDAGDVAIVATGHACTVLNELLASREVDKKVKAIVQVVGGVEPARISPPQLDVKRWYIQHNMVVVSEDHPIRTNKAFRNSAGLIETTTMEKPTQALRQALPKIRRFIREKLGMPEPMETDRHGVHQMAAVEVAKG